MLLSLLAVVGVLTPMRQLPPPAGIDVWVEPVAVIKASPQSYHPILRFMSGSTYLLQTTDYIQQGQVSIRDGHYTFRAITAMELENYFKDRLIEAMPPKQAKDSQDAYVRSMQNSEGDYNEHLGALEFTCVVKGLPKTFQLYRFTDARPTSWLTPPPEDKGLIGLWQGPDMFPERLDGKTRYKIGGIEGLQSFAREANISEASLLGILDLWPDHHYRSAGTIGTWVHDGSTLILIDGSNKIYLTITADGKLKQGGTVMFVR